MKREVITEASGKYRTPFYVFDLDALQQRMEEIKRVLSGRVALCYAMKANPFLVEALDGWADKIEICSPGEYHICKRSKMKKSSIVFSGVYKDPETLYDALESYHEFGVFTIESMQHLALLDGWSRKYSRKVKVYIRLTSGNQFGMDEEAVNTIIRQRDAYPFLEIAGIHYFSGTQKRNLLKIEKELMRLDEFCIKLKREYQFTVKELEYGPGAAVSYFEGDKKLPGLSETINVIAETIGKMQFGGHVTLEMGRFLVAMCGFYVTKICDIKQNAGENYCIVDGGMHHLNYDGQLKGMYLPYMDKFPVREGGQIEKWNICGALCTVNDVICRQKPLAGVEIGDILVFERTGAYSVTEGMSLFLSRDLPQVFFYSKKDGFTCVREGKSTYPWNCGFL